MKITYLCPAEIDDDPVVDINSFNGAKYLNDSLYNYMDFIFIELGIIGGEVGLLVENEQLKLTIDYWCNKPLDSITMANLAKDTRGQLEDGMGEGGFRFIVNDKPYDIFALWYDGLKEGLECRSYDDGRKIPGPPDLYINCMKGDYNQVEHLLRNTSCIDSYVQGYTPLHIAIIYGHVEIISLLLAHGADPNIVTRDGYSTLHKCALTRSLDDEQAAKVARMLIAKGARVELKNNRGPDAMEYAENRKKVLLLKELEAGISSQKLGKE